MWATLGGENGMFEFSDDATHVVGSIAHTGSFKTGDLSYLLIHIHTANDLEVKGQVAELVERGVLLLEEIQSCGDVTRLEDGSMTVAR